MIVSAQQSDIQEMINPDAKADINIEQLKSYVDAGWYIPAWDLLDYYFSGNHSPYVTHYANLVFPDSIVRYESSDATISYSWLCAVGSVLDPRSDMYVSPLSPFQDFRVDSLFIYAWYNVVNAMYTDTLIAEFVVGTPLTSPHFAHTIYVFSPDTLRASPPKMLGDTALKGYYAKLTATDKIIVKYPLTMNDSTMGSGKYIQFPVGIEVPAGKIIGVSLSFVPGYDYSFNEVLYSYLPGGALTQELNSFRAGLYAVNSTDDYPSLFFDPFDMYNLSCYIHKKGRYKLYPESWRNERMNSLISWGFDFGWKVSAQDNVSVEHPHLEVVNIFPNPANDVVVISMNHIPNFIRIFDIQGRTMLSFFPQNTQEQIDISSWSQGIYTVEIGTSGNNIHSRFVKQ